MHLTNLLSANRFRSLANWRTWLAVGAVLIAAHAFSAWHYAVRYQSGGIVFGSKTMTLDMTPDDWRQTLGGSDAASYLQVGENIAAGRGVTVSVNDKGSVRYEPFNYWGPGAPMVFGVWLKLFGARSMWPLFWFSVTAQFVFGLLAVATAALWTRSLPALLLVAICTGCCPPLQGWFYSTNLTCSEIVSLVPLAAFVYAFARGMIAFRQADGTFWRVALQWRVSLWFLLAGVFVGLNSLVRDSATILGAFTAVFLCIKALLTDRRRLTLAICSATMLMIGVNLVRGPVMRWNRRRTGNSVVSTGVKWGLWRLSLWQPHDKYPWYLICGVGMGEYLDPAAAERVDKYFRDERDNPEWYSFQEFALAVCKRPLDAAEFKLVRLPVLWLGTTDYWPRIHWSLAPIWCAAFYGALALFCGIQWRRRRRIPEALYLCFLMMFCASAIVHFEFRYTFPVWNTLVMAPGLVVAALLPKGWREESPGKEAAGPTAAIVPEIHAPGTGQPAIAA